MFFSMDVNAGNGIPYHILILAHEGKKNTSSARGAFISGLFTSQDPTCGSSQAIFKISQVESDVAQKYCRSGRVGPGHRTLSDP